MSLPLGSTPPAHSPGDVVGRAPSHPQIDADARAKRPAVRAMFVHAPRSLPPDEAALARWWQRFGDPELDRLIEASCEQGFEVCAASLRLQQACERHAAEQHAAEQRPADFAAICDYYDARIRQIAATARDYFIALCLQERIACIDAAIGAEATARRAQAVADAEYPAEHDGEARPALLAELHAHRIRLHTHWDASVIALARHTAQPVDLLGARLQGRQLPAANAETPALGGPEELACRRPDVLAAEHRAAGPGDAVDLASRLRRLEAEQHRDLAEKQVELALATLAGIQAELIPVRASLAAVEARDQRLRRAASIGALRTGAPRDTTYREKGPREIGSRDIDPREATDPRCALHAIRDREIETRGRAYLALVETFLVAGCGWPILCDPASPASGETESAL